MADTARARCEDSTALGRPVVPPVKITEPGPSGSVSTSGKVAGVIVQETLKVVALLGPETQA